VKVIKGNIWDYWKKGYWIVIPTNGTIKKNGECVMGRGLALQAKNLYKGLPKMLGSDIKKFGNFPHCYKEYHIITFPVKYNYWEKADLKLIELSANLINKLTSLSDDKIALPKVGCGNGKLNWKEVEPILDKYLDERFIVVDLC